VGESCGAKTEIISESAIGATAACYSNRVAVALAGWFLERCEKDR
jgi:hypothetical protein